jgi:hypothetical protein
MSLIGRTIGRDGCVGRTDALTRLMEICEFFFGNFDRIDFEIVAFEGRRKCFFGSCPVGSVAFDLVGVKNLNYTK